MNKCISLVVILLAICIIPCPLRAHDRPQDISTWISLSPPIPEFMENKRNKDYSYDDPGVAHYVANWSENSWKLSISGDKVCAEMISSRYDFNSVEQPPFDIPESDPFLGRRICVEVEDGWLVGFNAGEFGASLWWFSPDGKERYKVSDIQVMQFVRWNDGLYALEGLAHLGLSRGNLVRLITEGENAKWVSGVVARLPGAPFTAVVDKHGALFVVTDDSLIRMTSANKVEVLLDSAFWGGLYPVSVVTNNDDYVYIGMRQGVAKWRLGDSPNTIEWLVPSMRYMDEELRSFCERQP